VEDVEDGEPVFSGLMGRTIRQSLVPRSSFLVGWGGAEKIQILFLCFPSFFAKQPHLKEEVGQNAKRVRA
jgi:hypothetical protein